MSIFNKIKWVLAILLVFLLILTTNLVDRQAFSSVKDSMTAIYEDRLVAKDIVFDLLVLIQEKELANISSDAAFYTSRNKVVDESIDGLILRFLDTKLTETEKRTFGILQENLNTLKNYEKSKFEQGDNNQLVIGTQLDKIRENLKNISKIQLTEGQRQLFITKDVFDRVDLLTKMEIYLLIILAIIIQIVVLYKPKEINYDN